MAIYGIYEYDEVPAQKFFRLARRLGSYEGAVVARATLVEERRNTERNYRSAPRQEMSNYERKAYADIETAQAPGTDYLKEKLRRNGVG